MNSPAAINSNQEFDARLQEVRSTGGSLADFETAVRSIAGSLGAPVSSAALLKLVRLADAFNPGPQDGSRTPTEPGPPVSFEGRPAAQLPEAGRTSDPAAPRKHRATGESVLAYGEYLAQHLTRWLATQRVHDTGERITTYVALMARDDFRETVGWARSLDAHAVMALVAERGLGSSPGTTLDEPLEEAMFRWLHLATYEQVDTEHLAEMRARRAIRLQHRYEPASEVANRVSELSLDEELPFTELVGYVSRGALTGDQLARSLADLAAHDAGDRADWEARVRGFADTDDLAFGGDALQPALEAYAGGHLLRWMVDRDVPVTLSRLRSWSYYAADVVDTLVRRPRRTGGETISATLAHHAAVHLLRTNGDPVPLVDELALLAWLAERTRIAIHLTAWLEERDRRLTESLTD